MLPSTDLIASATRSIAFSMLYGPAHPYRCQRFACPLAGTDARLAEKRELVTPSFQRTFTSYLLPVRLAHQIRACIQNGCREIAHVNDRMSAPLEPIDQFGFRLWPGTEDLDRRKDLEHPGRQPAGGLAVAVDKGRDPCDGFPGSDQFLTCSSPGAVIHASDSSGHPGSRHPGLPWRTGCNPWVADRLPSGRACYAPALDGEPGAGKDCSGKFRGFR